MAQSIVRWIAASIFLLGASAKEFQRNSFLTYYYGPTTAEATLYRPLSGGGLAVASNYSINLRAPSTSYYYPPPPTPPSAPAAARRIIPDTYLLTMKPTDVNTSQIYKNVGCLDVSLKTSSTGIAAFLTTYADYESIRGVGTLILPGANIVSGVNLSSSNPGPLRPALDPEEYYVLVVYSLDRVTQLVSYQISAYPPNAPECAAAGSPGGGSGGRKLLQAADAPAPAAGSGQTVQINNVRILRYGDVGVVGVVTNASCVAYKLLAQPPAYLGTSVANKLIDADVFLLDETTSASWVARTYDQELIRTSVRAACFQNNTFPGDCVAYADGLNPSSTYILWQYVGFQLPFASSTLGTALFDITFTAQASGSCANNPVQNLRKQVTQGNVTTTTAG